MQEQTVRNGDRRQVSLLGRNERDRFKKRQGQIQAKQAKIRVGMCCENMSNELATSPRKSGVYTT